MTKTSTTSVKIKKSRRIKKKEDILTVMSSDQASAPASNMRRGTNIDNERVKVTIVEVKDPQNEKAPPKKLYLLTTDDNKTIPEVDL